MRFTSNNRFHLATIYALTLGLFGILALFWLTDWRELASNAVPLVVFFALSFVLKRAGFHVAPQVTHSLVGIIDLAAVLVFGPILGAWVAAASGFTYLLLTNLRHERDGLRSLVEIPVFNAGLKIGMAYASTRLYTLLGGTFPPREVSLEIAPAMLGAALAWFGVDHIGWGLFELLRGGRQGLANFLRSIIFYSILIEFLPLPFALVIAVAYAGGSPGLFAMISLGLLGTGIVVQRFADTSRRLELRTNDLTALNKFGRELSNAAFDENKVVDLLHEHASSIVLPDLCQVGLVSTDGNPGLRLVLEVRANETRHPDEKQADTALLDYFAKHRDPIRALDVNRSFVYPLEATALVRELASRVQIDGDGPRSALVLPMFAGDELIGCLSMYSARARVFFPVHARSLLSMCAQAAVTLQNARLFTVERKRATQLAMVSEVSRQVASVLDLDELLQNVVNQIRERFGYGNIHIFTVDRESGSAVFRASTHPRGIEWREKGIGYRIGLQGLVGWVAALGEPLLVNDVTKDPRFAPYPDKPVEETRSELVVPLTVGGEVVGVLDVESSEFNAFDEDDLFILKTLAAQVAVALEDARLFNLQREEAYYLNVLLQVAENLSQTSNLDESLETVVRITPLLVGVARCALFLYLPREKVFVPAKAYGLGQELQEEFNKLRIPADNGLAFETLVRELKPLVVEEDRASDMIEQQYLKTFGVRSLLIAPLITHNEIVGAILVDQGSRPSRFTKHEMDVVMGIANQAGVAVETARLTIEAEDKRRLEYELGLARQIQQSFLPEACPFVPGYEICAWWQSAREVSGDFYDFISLPGGRLAIVIADVSDKGMAAAMFMALSRTILRTMIIGKQSPREAIERANDVILADAQADMFVTVLQGVLNTTEHRFTYVNAGHNPPLLYRAARKELTTLDGHGIALGVMPNITLDERQVSLAPGDLLLLYTDGLTDAINAREEEFGIERLERLIAANAHKTPDGLIEEVKRTVSEFAGEGIHFDDVTMIAVKRAGG